MFKLSYIVSLICLITLLSSSEVEAQYQDSFSIKKHRHLKANLSSLAFSVFLNRGNRYFLASGRDWADVSWARWKQNVKQLPEWDWDLYTTNWFAHPMQGAMYYNAARTQNIGYVGSMAYSALGTTLWEYFGEDLPPSTNDFYTTILGGIHMGEVLFRLSENILDERTYGRKRLIKEVLAGFVNPIGGVSRLIYGEFNDHHDFKNHLNRPLKSQLSFSGIYMLNTSNESFQTVIPNFKLSVDYGEIKYEARNFSPFEVFWFRTWLRFDKFNQETDRAQFPIPYFNLKSSAIVHGKTMDYSDNKVVVVALFQDYDYFKNFTYELSSLAFTFGAIHKVDLNSVSLSTRAQFGGIALAAIRSKAIDLVRPETEKEERDYTMGPGYLIKFTSLVDMKEYGSFEFTYDHWKSFISSGPSGNEKIHQVSFSYSIPVFDKYAIKLAFSHFNRDGDYEHDNKDYNYNDHNTELQLGLSCFFN